MRHCISDTTKQLNAICLKTTNPTMLNTLHACRDSHPLGQDNKWKWRNAWFLAMQQKASTFSHDDLVWLNKQAQTEPPVA